MHRDAQGRPQVDAERLLSEYRATRDPDILARVVEAHLYIAAIIARRFSSRGVEYDDLYQVASLALFKSIERYDPERGVRFATFVTPNMVGEVKNYFRDRSRAIRLPRRGQQLMRTVEAKREELAQSLGRQHTLEEIAESAELSLEEVIESLELRGAASPVSLDALPQEEDDREPLAAYLGAEEAGFAEIERDDLVNRALAGLEERHREVIRLRFFQGLSQREAAERLGVSQMWVSRAERKALEQMRETVSQGEKGGPEAPGTGGNG